MGKTKSRTTNTILNFISSIGGQLLTVVLQFAVRTVFINTLSESYLGINGLFSNILSMLSLAELGLGTAILFKLYEPIAKDNYNRITILMQFYRKAYTYIGIVVGVIGLCLIPFLPNLIKDYDKMEALNINVEFIFILYLFRSVSSYLFFAYKSAIIRANQKGYILNVVHYLVTTVSSIIQIILLIWLKNFVVYVFVLVFAVIVENVIYAAVANKMYPYINDKKTEKLSKDEVISVVKDCSALFLYKLNEVAIKSTDNIILSIYGGLSVVASYSNYYVLYTTIKTLFGKIYSSTAHSIGNLHTTHDEKHEYEVFEAVNLITVLLGGTAFVGIFVVADEFVHLWIGDSWVIPQPFSFLMGLEIYTMAIRKLLGNYRNAMGLFQQAKYRPLAGMIVNLIVSVALVKRWGICGVLLGTIIADLTTVMWFDPIIIHKYGFRDSYAVRNYYLKNLKYIVVTLIVAVVDYLICMNFITGCGWISVIIHALICGVTVPIAMLITTFKTDENKYVRRLVMRYVTKFKKNCMKRG